MLGPYEGDAQPAFLNALFALGAQCKKGNLPWESALAAFGIGDFESTGL